MKTKPLRVLQIIAGFALEGPLGGIERFGIELARVLAHDLAHGNGSRNFEPILCGLWDFHTPFDQVWCGRLNSEGIQAFIAAPKDDRSPYFNYVHLLQGILRGVSKPVDIIHSHSEFGDVAAMVLKHRLGAKALVRTVHNEREWGKRPLRRLLLPNLLYPFVFDAELGVAQRVVDNLDQRWVARSLGRKATRMYNALNFERFAKLQVDKAAKRASLGLPPHGPLIGTVGRLTLQKGYHILLEAVPTILRHYPDAHFLIVGTGDLATALQEQAQRSGLENQVHFTGARSDVEELFAIFDLFVSSSLWEGLPTVILESMAAGVAVVATRVSGSTELVNEGVTGRLVQPGDPMALATGIVEMLNHHNQSTPMIAQARQFVMERA